MSVLNRMLKDLEARGIDTEGTVPVAPRGSRRLPLPGRQGVLVILAASLTVLAVVLWRQQDAPSVSAVNDVTAPLPPATREPAAERVAPQTSSPRTEPVVATPTAVAVSAESEPAPLARVEPQEPEPAAVADPEPAAEDEQQPAAVEETPPEPTFVRREPEAAPEVLAGRRLNEARQALANGAVADSGRLLEQALELEPELHAARELLVALQRRRGDDDAARRLLATGVSLAPGHAGFAKQYARLLVDIGALERAAETLDGAAAAGAGDVEYHALAAAIARQRGRHDQAVQGYRRALELDSGNGTLWLGLASSLEAQGRIELALQAFAQARATGTLTPSLESWTVRRMRALETGN